MNIPRRIYKLLFSTVAMLFLLVTATLPAFAQTIYIVLFDANWCASCHEFVPIIREVATQNHLKVREIDVDAQNAQRTAANLGLSIPTRTLPQVFIVTSGKATQILDGSAYRLGDGKAVREAILQGLHQHGIH